jgi:hypothetical protein
MASPLFISLLFSFRLLTCTGTVPSITYTVIFVKTQIPLFRSVAHQQMNRSGMMTTPAGIEVARLVGLPLGVFGLRFLWSRFNLRGFFLDRGRDGVFRAVGQDCTSEGLHFG